MIDKRTLPLSALRAFERAAYHLHLGRAGEDLGVTHGAISHQVRSLEERLEVKLFTRAHNRLDLTPAGSRLYESVSQGLNTILEGTHNLNPDKLTGSLVIACTQTIATSWAAKHICEFQLKYPTIKVTIKEIAPRQKTISSDIDVAICYGKPRMKGTRVTSLASPLLFPICSPTLIEDRGKPFRIRNLSSFTLLHDNQVSWDRWFTEHTNSTNTAKNSIYFPNTSQALTAARLGYGIALCNEFETQEFIKQGQLITIIGKSVPEERDYFLYCRHDRNDSLKSRIFEDWIINSCVQT